MRLGAMTPGRSVPRLAWSEERMRRRLHWSHLARAIRSKLPNELDFDSWAEKGREGLDKGPRSLTANRGRGSEVLTERRYLGTAD
jgi:predicted RNase H-like nuclease (RuvC/YqgF family)